MVNVWVKRTQRTVEEKLFKNFLLIKRTNDAVLPLMLMAAAAGGVIALRRRRVAVKE